MGSNNLSSSVLDEVFNLPKINSEWVWSKLKNTDLFSDSINFKRVRLPNVNFETISRDVLVKQINDIIQKRA